MGHAPRRRRHPRTDGSPSAPGKRRRHRARRANLRGAVRRQRRRPQTACRRARHSRPRLGRLSRDAELTLVHDGIKQTCVLPTDLVLPPGDFCGLFDVPVLRSLRLTGIDTPLTKPPSGAVPRPRYFLPDDAATATATPPSCARGSRSRPIWHPASSKVRQKRRRQALYGATRNHRHRLVASGPLLQLTLRLNRIDIALEPLGKPATPVS